jgi:hypothetical protein
MRALNDRRVLLGGGALVTVLILAIGWFALIGPRLSATADANSQRESVELSNSQLQARVAALRKLSADPQALVASLSAALKALPMDSDVASFQRQISDEATATGVEISSVTVGDPSAVQGATGQAAAPAQWMQVPVTLLTSGPAASQAKFLDGLQYTISRRALVSSVSVTPASGATAGSIDDASSMTVGLTLYYAPKSTQTQQQLQSLLNGKLTR